MVNVDLSIVRTNHSDAGFVMGKAIVCGVEGQGIYIYIYTYSLYFLFNFTMTIKLFLKQPIAIQAKVFSIYGSFACLYKF